jgi:hypothetical protein
MIITHYLEIYPRDTDIPKLECLCDRDSGITIISNILDFKLEKRFFITFTNIDEGSNEVIKGLGKDGQCYYSPKMD